MAQHDPTLRPPEQVMRLSRMGSFHQSRLSFMRIILRRFKRDNWRFERREFEIDVTGVGHAVYTAHGPERSYSLVAFAHDLPDDQRSDRVIAEAWDCTFTLYDGIPSAADIERLSKNVPLQEAGRISETELSLSRANRSVRMWAHVVDSLAAGHQPDMEKVWSVGYLMRTTAVYGSGKFGAADRETLADRPEFFAPFQVEMLSVYLIRTFVRDLVEYMAHLRSPDTAVRLATEAARALGIGNSTGLGMAPFLLTHPRLLNNWIAARETALARVRAVKTASKSEIAVFRNLLERSILSVSYWRSVHPIQVEKLACLNADLPLIESYLGKDNLTGSQPWDRLYRWAEENLSVEGQELLVSLMLEPYGALVDDLADQMSADEASAFCIDGAMQLSDLRQHVEAIYGWALEIEWEDKASQARAWYVSEEKLEPRLGERFDEPIADYEQPLSPGRDTAWLYQSLQDWQGGPSVAAFLLKHPEHRHSVRRVQAVADVPYAEIRDNTIGSTVLPIDMLRCKLSFFGALHFDPRSDRWVRICMYSDAPYPDELATADTDFWVYPRLEEMAQ